MSEQQFEPQEALDLVLGKLREHAPSVAGLLEDAMRKGKEVECNSEPEDRRQRSRVVWKTLPLSTEEKLTLVERALRTLCYEQAQLCLSVHKELQEAALGPSPQHTGEDESPSELPGVGEAKSVVIDVHDVPDFTGQGRETLDLLPPSEDEMRTLNELLATLGPMLTFGEE